MTMAPARSFPLFAEMVNVTVPFPLPDCGDVNVIHDASLAAVHAHSPEVATVTLPFSPAGPTLWLAGRIS